MDNETLKIGFANKYYTLWRLSERLVDTPCGGSEVVKEYTYVKNISMDEETAKSKYPNIEYDETLKGKTGSFTIYEKPKQQKVGYAPNVYHFGKYKGESFEEAGDVSYAVWYWENGGFWNCESEHGNCLMEYLGKFGYVFGKTISEYDGTPVFIMMTPDEVKEAKIAEMEYKEFEKDVLSGKPVSITADRNLDEHGNYTVVGNFGNPDTVYHFSETKEMRYNGYVYRLPVIKDKAKRIKGKTITINEYTSENKDGSVMVYVKNFSLAK